MRPFFLTTIPKSGTHLVTQFLKLAGLQRHPFAERRLVESFEYLYFHGRHPRRYMRATGKNVGAETLKQAEIEYRRSFEASCDLLRGIRLGTYAFYHVPYSRTLADALRAMGLPIVFLCRDPRDVAFSVAHHILRRRDDGKYAALAALGSDEDRYAAVVRGRAGREPLPMLPLAYLFERYEGWLSQPDVLTLRYEDIIGPRGGGDAGRQQHAYARLAAHIGLNLSGSELTERIDSIYSETAPFFVTGRIGQWKAKMTPRLDDAFRESLGPTIERWTGENGWCEKSWSWGSLARARRRLLGF